MDKFVDATELIDMLSQSAQGEASGYTGDEFHAQRNAYESVIDWVKDNSFEVLSQDDKLNFLRERVVAYKSEQEKIYNPVSSNWSEATAAAQVKAFDDVLKLIDIVRGR